MGGFCQFSCVMLVLGVFLGLVVVAVVGHLASWVVVGVGVAMICGCCVFGYLLLLLLFRCVKLCVYACLDVHTIAFVWRLSRVLVFVYAYMRL